MKYTLKFLLMVIISTFLLSTLAIAAPIIDGRMYTGTGQEWSTDPTNPNGLNATVANPGPGNLNPTATSRGNVHSEDGSMHGNIYDLNKLGFYVDDNMLYIGMQSIYDITDSSRAKWKPGDFIFQFQKTESNLNSISTVAMDFSFNGSAFTGLDIHYGDQMQFINAAVHQTTLGYKVDSNNGSYNTKSVDFSIAANQAEYTNIGGSSIELAIDLNTLTGELSAIFADSTYAQMHWQMACGNDILYVADNYTYNPVPEPATMLLFSLGLIGMGAIGRKKQGKE